MNSTLGTSQDTPAIDTLTQKMGLWKTDLQVGRDRLKKEFEQSASPHRLLKGHCALIDHLLREIWTFFQMPGFISLVAVGGYGRGELYPYSDIDLLILLNHPADESIEKKLQQLVGAWWDIGLETGHSVRTIDECVSMGLQDITAKTNMLENRVLCGDLTLYQKFLSATRQAMDALAFFQAKRIEQRQRHERYASTNLEPNVKETAGGLRDLQHILWIAQASGLGKSWQELLMGGVISKEEARHLTKTERFLQILRIRLHFLASRREDRLIFDLQSPLAQAYGIENRPNRRASEQLMQRYYRCAKTVSQLELVVQQSLRSLLTNSKDKPLLPLNEFFGVRNELLAIRDENLYQTHPQTILDTFLTLQQHPEIKDIGASTQRALWRARKWMDLSYRKNPIHQQQFLSILKNPDRVVRELRRMHRLGILSRYIPAFGKIVGQMQHDLYHVYTVDEHILRVVRNLRRFAVPNLAHEFPLCSRLISEFENPEVLYLAGLFHDIAKGRGGDHSTLGTVDARRFCQSHHLAPEDSQLVEWLVGQHLMMSATAQKQDLSDPLVIQQFASKVGNTRRLSALYLLTVADIRGTSPKVWNAWKGKLLEDLFLMTQRLFSGQAGNEEHSQRTRQEEARGILHLYGIDDNVINQFWGKLDTAYFIKHEAKEIAWHTRLLCYRQDPTQLVIRARPSQAGEGLQVMVYGPDQEELFACICAFFESIHYNIQDASVYTSSFGYALDTFEVQDPDKPKTNYRDLTAFVEHELTQLLTSKALPPHIGQTRLGRQMRHFPISPEVQLQNDERGIYQILSIIAGDRPGLLSRIARIFLQYKIRLHNAKINTMGERAEDTFLITGECLADSKKLMQMENDLIETLKI